jgi:hypothetical protein
MGLIAPAQGASLLLRIRGGLIIFAIVATLLALGFGIAMLVSLPFGGTSTLSAIFLGLLIVTVALVVLGFVGRRRQNAAKEKARAARAGG